MRTRAIVVALGMGALAVGCSSSAGHPAAKPTSTEPTNPVMWTVSVSGVSDSAADTAAVAGCEHPIKATLKASTWDPSGYSVRFTAPQAGARGVAACLARVPGAGSVNLSHT